MTKITVAVRLSPVATQRSLVLRKKCTVTVTPVRNPRNHRPGYIGFFAADSGVQSGMTKRSQPRVSRPPV